MPLGEDKTAARFSAQMWTRSTNRYSSMRVEKSLQASSTSVTHCLIEGACAWPFSTKLSATWRSSLTCSRLFLAFSWKKGEKKREICTFEPRERHRISSVFTVGWRRSEALGNRTLGDRSKNTSSQRIRDTERDLERHCKRRRERERERKISRTKSLSWETYLLLSYIFLALAKVGCVNQEGPHAYQIGSKNIPSSSTLFR